MIVLASVAGELLQIALGLAMVVQQQIVQGHVMVVQRQIVQVSTRVLFFIYFLCPAPNLFLLVIPLAIFFSL